VWAWINAILLTAAVVIAAKEAARRWLPDANERGRSIAWAIAAGAALLSADKIRVVFTQGQTDFIMLLGFACVLRWVDRKPLSTGAIIGLTANIKYLSLICVPWFVWKKNYRAALSSIVFFLLFFFLPAVQIGPARMLEYAQISGGGLIRMTGIPLDVQKLRMPSITWNSSVSVPSTVFRFTRARGISDGVSVAISLSVLLGVALSIYAVARAQGVQLFRRERSSANAADSPITSLEWAVLVTIATAFSPQATVRHMLLSMLIYTVAFALLLREREWRPRVLLALAMLLMVAAMSLPPPSRALTLWRAMGGAGWCAILLMLAVVWVGARVIAAKSGQTALVSRLRA